MRISLLLAFALVLLLPACGSGDGTPDTADPELSMTLVGGLFRYDCSSTADCPEAPNIGANTWDPETIFVPLGMWRGTTQEVQIDLRALDLGGFGDVVLYLRLPTGMDVLDPAGADVVTSPAVTTLTFRFDPLAPANFLNKRVLIRLDTVLGSSATIEARATDAAGNAVWVGPMTVFIT